MAAGAACCVVLLLGHELVSEGGCWRLPLAARLSRGAEGRTGASRRELFDDSATGGSEGDASGFAADSPITPSVSCTGRSAGPGADEGVPATSGAGAGVAATGAGTAFCREAR